MAMKFLMVAMPVTCLARLGVPTNSNGSEASLFRPSPEDLLPGGKARGAEYWENFTVGDAGGYENSTRNGYYHNPSIPILVDIMKSMGYDHLATSTQYEDTCCASCGKISTAELVRGTGFYAVASAESMQQNDVAGGHWCTANAPDKGDTVGMGCLSCAKGKFMKAHPWSYPLQAPPGSSVFTQEINIVVADTCPHTTNEAWCPRHLDQPNKFGIKNHFDFANPPAHFDNYYFAFSRIECPWSIKQRYQQISRCR